MPNIAQERNAIVSILLSFVTCGIYAFYVMYATTDELKQTTRDDSLNPMMDVLLALVTCGLWMYFVMYRNAQKTHQALVQLQPQREDRSQLILILAVATFFVGVTGIVAMYFSYEEHNALARATRA